jgi:hypothetical protein
LKFTEIVDASVNETISATADFVILSCLPSESTALTDIAVVANSLVVSVIELLILVVITLVESTAVADTVPPTVIGPTAPPSVDNALTPTGSTEL